MRMNGKITIKLKKIWSPILHRYVADIFARRPGPSCFPGTMNLKLEIYWKVENSMSRIMAGDVRPGDKILIPGNAHVGTDQYVTVTVIGKQGVVPNVQLPFFRWEKVIRRGSGYTSRDQGEYNVGSLSEDFEKSDTT